MEFLELQPLSEPEKVRSEGKFLLDMLGGRLKSGLRSDSAAVPYSDLEERIKSGGYAEPLLRDAHRARRWRANYIRTIVEREITEIFGIRNQDLLARLIELLAWRTGQLLNVSDLAKNLQANRLTVEQYLRFSGTGVPSASVTCMAHQQNQTLNPGSQDLFC